MIALMSKVIFLPLLYWQIFLIFAVWLLVLTYFFVKRFRVLLFFVGGAGLFVAGFAVTWYYQMHSMGILSLTRPATLYAGPSKKYHELHHIDAPVLCCIKKEYDRWMCVEHESGKGWLSLEQQI